MNTFQRGGLPRRIAIFLPSLLVVVLILIEGTQRFSIQQTAGYVAPFWFRHFSSLPYQRYWEFVEALRKLGHLTGYGLVCVSFFGTIYWRMRRRLTAPENRELKNRAAGWALILTMLLGATDELHQHFVPQRTSTITDIGFDVCGGYFAILLLFRVLRPRQNHRLTNRHHHI